MKLIYTAGRYSANTEEGKQANIALAREYAVQIWDSGNACICPHLNTANLEHLSSATYDDYIIGDFRIISGCDAVLMLPGWEMSHGAVREKEYAEKIGLPIIYSITRLRVIMAGG